MKKLTRYGKKRFDALISNLKAYAQVPEDEKLHQVRVEIKKLKAIQRAVGTCAKKFDVHRNFIPLRDIFRQAGGIRSPQVMNQLLKENHIQGLDNDELEMVPDRIEKFKKKVPAFLRKARKGRKELNKHVRSVSKKRLSSYVNSRLNEVKEHLYPSTSFERLHNVRKTIKEVIYLSDVLKGIDRVMIQKLKSLEELAGQFHDQQAFIEWLEARRCVDKAQIDKLKSNCRDDQMEIKELVDRIYVRGRQ